MGDTYVVDSGHMPSNEEVYARIPAPARRLWQYVERILDAAAACPPGAWADTGLRCRRRPGRRPCPGTIQVLRSEVPAEVRWGCSSCDDNGLIHSLEGTRWHRPARNRAGTSSRPTTRAAASHTGSAARNVPDATLRHESVETATALTAAILDRVNALVGNEVVLDDAEYLPILRTIIDATGDYLRAAGITAQEAGTAVAALAEHARHTYVATWLLHAYEVEEEGELDEEIEAAAARRAFEAAFRPGWDRGRWT